MGLLLAAAILLSAPAFAQDYTVKIQPSAEGPASAEKAMDCISFYWIGMEDTDDGIAQPGDTEAMMAWLDYLTSTTGKSQGDLRPLIEARKEQTILDINHPNDPERFTRPRSRCAAYESRAKG